MAAKRADTYAFFPFYQATITFFTQNKGGGINRPLKNNSQQ